MQVPQGPLDCPPWPPPYSKTTPTSLSPSPRMSKLVDTPDVTSGNSLMFQIRKPRLRRFVLPKVKHPSLPAFPWVPSSRLLGERVQKWGLRKFSLYLNKYN